MPADENQQLVERGGAAQALRALQLSASPLLPRTLKRRLSRVHAEWTSRRVHAQLAALASGSEPIVAGPWLGEVGFELLYWIPFLAWFVERFDVPPERMVIVSRGGTRDWYAHLASHYRDVFDHVTPAEFRARNDQRSAELGEQKQIAATAFDRRLLAPVLAELGVAPDRVLHPSLMFRVFRPYWWRHLDSTWVGRHARFRTLSVSPEAELLSRLPPDYVAVKFYYNDSFPATDTNRLFARDLLRGLRERGPIVSLSTGLAIDDHEGWEEEETLAAHGIRADLSPANNLRLQTLIVANAREWVGTYGGFAYLAPFHNVSATAYFSNPDGFSKRHLALAQEVFARLSPSPLLTLHDVLGETVVE